MSLKMKSKNEIFVSISCTTYNHAEYIRKCLDGFLMQKCDFAFEILIHDDASTDGTQEIIKEYQEKYPNIIKPILREENLYSKGERGFNGRFNFTRAEGKYIAICEGDDYWIDSLKLQKQVDFLEKNQDYFACFHHRKVLNERGLLVDRNIKRNDFIEDTTLVNGEIIQTSIPIFSLLLRNDLNDYVNINFGSILGGDVLLRSFIATKGKVRYLHFYGGVYRRHNGGVFSSLNRLTGLEKSIETRLRILKVLPNVDSKSLYISICKIYISLIREKLKNKDFSFGKDILKLVQFFGKALFG